MIASSSSEVLSSNVCLPPFIQTPATEKTLTPIFVVAHWFPPGFGFEFDSYIHRLHRNKFFDEIHAKFV